MGTTGKVLRAARLVLFVLPRSTKPQSAPLLPIRTGFAHLVKISLIVVSQKHVRAATTSNVKLASLDITFLVFPHAPLVLCVLAHSIKRLAARIPGIKIASAKLAQPAGLESTSLAVAQVRLTRSVLPAKLLALQDFIAPVLVVGPPIILVRLVRSVNVPEVALHNVLALVWLTHLVARAARENLKARPWPVQCARVSPVVIVV